MRPVSLSRCRARSTTEHKLRRQPGTRLAESRLAEWLVLQHKCPASSSVSGGSNASKALLAEKWPATLHARRGGSPSRPAASPKPSACWARWTAPTRR